LGIETEAGQASPFATFTIAARFELFITIAVDVPTAASKFRLAAFSTVR
jgi:hypothetical protein